MNAVEQQILEELTAMDRAVQEMRNGGPRPNLLEIFDRLDQLARHLPRGTDPDLLHYMHKKSYEKARLLLEGRNAENKRGTCG